MEIGKSHWVTIYQANSGWSHRYRQQRAIARPFFARERIADFEIFERNWSRTLAILSSLESSNNPCEAQDLYYRFTLDAASEFLFGKNLDTLSASLPVPGTPIGPKGSATEDTWGSFMRAFESAQQNITNRGRLGSVWPLFELFRDKNEEHSTVIKEWLDPLVHRALEDKRRLEAMGAVNPIADKSFIQHLADSTNGKSFRNTFQFQWWNDWIVHQILLSYVISC